MPINTRLCRVFRKWYDLCLKGREYFCPHKCLMRKLMKRTIPLSFISLLLILSILLASLVNGQTMVSVGNANISQSTETEFENSYYIEDLSQSAEEGKIELTKGLENEVEKVENSLASIAGDRKGTILVDKFGGKRLA